MELVVSTGIEYNRYWIIIKYQIIKNNLYLKNSPSFAYSILVVRLNRVTVVRELISRLEFGKTIQGKRCKYILLFFLNQQLYMHIQVKMKINFSLILIYIRVENTLRVLIPPLTQTKREMPHKDFIITIISTCQLL